ncbi:MAG: di-heme-cytochrome C peroxidase [Beijerinckiaceae bacterium]
MNIRYAFQTASLAGVMLAMATLDSPAGSAPPVTLDQGKEWTEAARKDFYSRDQGSRLIPLRWIAALKQPDGEPFMAASLGRYGYLPNEASTPPGLPAGFNVANEKGVETLGMTCSACHTRQIEAGGVSYRIDGGPAIADFQSFVADLDTAVNRVLTDRAAFADFAQAVLGPSPPPDKEAALREAVQAWHTPFHTIMDGALPKDKPWGPGRLDALGMIFNRLTGLDIGHTASHMIPENIKTADAPVRYPFLWNAWRQDFTQWPGVAENGDKIVALARNLGEVYGVFGVFHPKKDESQLLGFDYLDGNSANFPGLDALEDLLPKIGPPKWPWAVDQALASAGKAIYARKTEQGGCADCHGIEPGKPRLLNPDTWATPIQDVGTDSREYGSLKWQVETGVLEGARIPFVTQKLNPSDRAGSVEKTAVTGAILQHYLAPMLYAKVPDERMLGKLKQAATVLAPQIEALKGAVMPAAALPPGFAYESRVLEGIWAAAPYLHNGSVPTLADLLKPAAERAKAFKVGPAYDPVNVGLAADQNKFNYKLETTDCSDRNSGNSRCGHEFGTKLSPDEKKALLEYLKIL